MSEASIKIGETAGKVWRFLRANGTVPLQSLPKELGINPNLVFQGVGWLAREANIEFTEKGNQQLVRLPLKNPAS